MRSYAVLSLVIGVVALCVSLPASAKLELRDLEDRARAYGEEVKKRQPPAGQQRDADRLVADAKAAAQKKTWAKAVELLEMAVAEEPDRVAAWLDLARAWSALDPDKPQAAEAAQIAYQRAKRRDDRNAALRLLADHYYGRYEVARKKVQHVQVEQSMLDNPPDGAGDRPASRGAGERARLTREFIAASDDTLSALGVARRVYQELAREARNDPAVALLANERSTEAGPELLRPLSGQVDVTDKSAAYCLAFNLPLQAEADVYRKFIDLSRDDKADAAAGLEKSTGAVAAPQLATNKTALCVHGLDHGRSYQLAVKRDLPSLSGLKTATDRQFQFRVPDRGPQFRVRPAAFVMPRDGDGQIPVRTVNVQQLTVELVRVADRSLARDIARRAIFNDRNVAASEAVLPSDTSIASSTELIWKGTADIARAERNKEVVTNLPIAKLIAERAALAAADVEAAKSGRPVPTTRPLNVEGLRGEIELQPAAFQEAVQGRSFNGLYALVIRGIVKAQPGLHGGPRDDLLARSTPGSGGPGDPLLQAEPFENKDAARSSDLSFPEPKAQWFVVTDIGIAVYEGPEKMYVAARSLSKAKPLSGLDVELVSNGNQVLHKARTGIDGVADMPARLARGTKTNRLAAVLVTATGDFAFVDYTNDSFDMTRRGVEGRAAPAALEALVYPDRGVYRPGEKVQALVLVRDQDGRAPESLPPLFVALRGRDGRALAGRSSRGEAQLGGMLVDLVLPMTTELGFEATVVDMASARAIAEARVDMGLSGVACGGSGDRQPGSSSSAARPGLRRCRHLPGRVGWLVSGKPRATEGHPHAHLDEPSPG